MALFISKLFKTGVSKLKNYDMYGTSIGFTYKGKDQFHTFIGAVVSLAVMAVVMLYSYTQLKIMLTNANTAMSTNSLVRDLYEDESNFYLNETDFIIAFSMANSSQNQLLDRRIVNLHITQIIETKNDDGTITQEALPIDYDT